jgi:hypothetical protein
MRHGSRAIPSCTAQKDSGAFCDRPSLPGAPFPICLKHAAQIVEFLDDVAPRDRDDRMIVAWRSLEQQRAGETERRRRAPDVYVVYYLQVGDMVKIGYTSNLPTRMRTYPPNSRLLAYESGGPALEAERHSEFAEELSAGREWFTPSDRLLAHISNIKAARAA